MNTNIEQAASTGSAIILQFPVGGRAGLSAHRAETAVELLPNVMYGSSWYHEEAIEQAPPTKG